MGGTTAAGRLIPQSGPTPAVRRLSGRGHLLGDALVAAAGLVLGVLLGATLLAQTLDGWSTPSGWLIGLGAIAAVTGTYGVTLLLILIARIPPLERSVGLDRLTACHRRLAPRAIGLVALHIYLAALGYALAEHAAPVSEVWSLITETAWFLPAAVGFGLMVLAAVSSWRADGAGSPPRPGGPSTCSRPSPSPFGVPAAQLHTEAFDT
jgi:hypothetical protein